LVAINYKGEYKPHNQVRLYWWRLGANQWFDSTYNKLCP